MDNRMDMPDPSVANSSATFGGRLGFAGSPNKRRRSVRDPKDHDNGQIDIQLRENLHYIWV